MSKGSFAGASAEGGRIFIVRHAQSAANAGRRTVDPATIPITEAGTLQAQCLADLISDRPHLIAVSSYLRTIQTAEPLVRRYPGVLVDEWRVEEFTYLDTTACTGTTYVERKALRDVYWTRCDPMWIDGPACESFADFIARVRCFERALNAQNPTQTVVVFTHGLVMRTMLWLQRHTAGQVFGADLADFDRYRRRISVPNCAVLRASPNGSGRLLLSTTVSVDHIPADLRSE